MSELARREGETIVLPGLVTAHSHAFQRGLRGRTHALAASEDSFWSWRGLMYRFAAGLDPERIFALSRLAFRELARNGVTAVGEFHYVQHQPDGTPYADRVVLADAVIRAAREVGLRITLLRVLYARGGWGRPLEATQKRFVDGDVDDALGDVDVLRKRFADDEGVRFGLAPHSVRAVPLPWLRAARDYAAEHGLPLHMHVAEQRRELAECLAEHGRRPVELLADEGVLSDRFVAVHATHLRPHEARQLGEAKGFACLCRTTERDLGDGFPDVQRLRASGVRLCSGVDSHARSDALEELRAIELDERARAEGRALAMDGSALLEAGTTEGSAAIAQPSEGDRVVLDATDASLLGAPESGPELADAVLFGADPRAIREVHVAGKVIALTPTPQERQAFTQAITHLVN